MASFGFERLKAEACPHCLETYAERRQRDKNAAPCARLPDGGLLCVNVTSSADLLSDSWAFVMYSSSWGGGLIKPKEDDPAQATFKQRLAALQAAAAAPALNLRERLQAQRDVAALERLHERAEQARIDGDREEKEEVAALIRKKTGLAEANRRKGLTGATPGLLPVFNRAIVGNLSERLAGQQDGLLRKLGSVVRQPGRGAYPAMAASPFADQEGRFCVPNGAALVLAADGNGSVRSVQVMNAPGSGAKYAYPSKGTFEGSETPEVRHLTTTMPNGLRDGGALFGGYSAMAQLLGEVTRSDVLIADGALKAWVTSLLTGAVALGSPGAQHRLSMHQLDAALHEIKEGLSVRPRVLIAVDAGDVLNPSSMIAQLIETREHLLKCGWDVHFLWWGQTSKEDGQDIDELHARNELLGGLQSTSFSRITGRELLALCPPEIRARQQRVLQRSTRTGAQQLSIEELEGMPIEARINDEEEIETYDPDIPGDRERVINEMADKGHRNFLLSDPPGSGKTYWAGHLQPEAFGARRLIFTTATPITFAEEFNWAYVLGRDQGRVLAPDGRVVRAQAGETNFYREPNCIKGAEIDTLRSANAGEAARATCAGCEYRGICSVKPGNYLADRILTSGEPRLACDPSSLQPQNDYWDVDGMPYTGASGAPATVGIFDEADTLPATSQLTVRWEHINATYKALRRYMPEPVRQVVQFLRDIVRPRGYDVLLGERLVEAMASKLSARTVRAAAKADPQLLLAAELQQLQRYDGTLTLCWLTDLLAFLRRKAPMQAWVSSSGLQIVKRNAQLINAVRSDGLKIRLFMDATSTLAEIERRLGVRCIRIQAREPLQGPPVRDIQIVGLGRLGFGRSPQQQMLLRRLRPLVPALLGIPEEKSKEALSWIDTKKDLALYDPDQRTSAWLAGSRGSNYMADVQALAMVGCPTRNLTSSAAEWKLFTGQEVNPGDSISTAMLMQATNNPEGHRWVSFTQGAENADYRRWAREHTEREMLQGKGRARFNRRPADTEGLATVTITDVPLPWPVEILEARDLLSEAAVDSITKLTSKRIEMAWEQTRYSGRRVELLLQTLEVDLATLQERCRFEDLAHRPVGKAVLANTNTVSYPASSKAANVLSATGSTARVVA